ncbi:hypothetical protein JOF47_001247 [Paeniglutamicibacter kerguelensis]|uniref:Uncharacterized protein n=1 Tax=Paeniglutamicibacter kerguelensis TaxID=254788 RepID=A0ABS4XBT1_9MICC|nr:hypothetical protein [Paeniglutamicibacter kerguelensis]
MRTGDATAHAIQRVDSIGICVFLPKGGTFCIILKVLQTERRGDFMSLPY